MPDILNLIKTRRSIRKYKSQDVPEDHLNKILEAARWSPSAINKQPWQFVVVKDQNIKKEISNNVHLTNRFVSKAPVIMVVCADLEKSQKWALVDCALACQNILLEAHSLGLGSCFIGAFNEDKIKNILKIPDKMKILGLITIGYPAEKPQASPRLDIDQIVSYDNYNQKKVKTSPLKTGILSIVAKKLKKRPKN